MKISLYVLGFGFVLSVAGLTAQTAQTQQQTPPVSPSTPANQVGDGAQTKSGTPVPPSSAPSTTGGVAGTASSSTAQTPDNQDSAGGRAMTDSDLQSQIQNALSKEPTLTGDSPHVTILGDTLELAGSVGTNKEKITATRIVQSYAGSKKLVNKLTINGRSEKPASSDNVTDRQPGSTSNPANNPESGKGTQPSNSKPPQK
jgi:hypothetical protein